jgi:filamentous hemagglutinin
LVKKLKEAVEGTRFAYDGSKIFRAIKDLREYGVKKGDWLYLDKMHGDHIEVFIKSGKALRTILNIDGTQNMKKLAQAGVRDILKYIR